MTLLISDALTCDVCVLLFFSDLCRECREGFIFQQQRDLREYAQATVYVRKVIDSKKVLFFLSFFKIYNRMSN